MNISFLLTGKPSTFLLYFLSFENSVCALYILERRFIKRYLFLQPRRVVVVKEASSSTSAASSAKFATAGTSAAQPSTSAALPSTSAAPYRAPSGSAAPSTSAQSSAGAPSSPIDLYARLRLRQAGDEIEEKIAAALRRFKELSANPSVSMQKNNKKNLCMLGSQNSDPRKKVSEHAGL